MAACTTCGAELPADARFCPRCGSPIAAAGPPAAEMLKLVTILFADIVGSTARTEDMHPEDARALMADYFAAMSEEIRAEGGTIEKFVGDAIMAVFGVPAAHEDDPVRAIRAGHRMLARLEQWNQRRLELVPRLTDSQEIGDAYAMIAWSAQYLGRYSDALAYASEGVSRSQENPGTYAHCLVYQIWAKFMLGDWQGALTDHAEMKRVLADDPRDFPPGPYMRAYAVVAFCRELRGEGQEAERLLDLVRRFLDEGGGRPGLVGAVSFYLRALIHRGLGFEEASRFPLTPPSEGTPILLEALCEHAAAAEDWEQARVLVQRAREESETTGLLALPSFADRLDGQMQRDPSLLRRSAEGFARLGAPWEEAWSRLQLAELTGKAADLGNAVETFERLGSRKELERARAVVGSEIPTA
jgi:tetratricopeptide (TPR) repeat protein